MMQSNDDITVKNIIQCSADAVRSSAERYLFLAEFIFGQNDLHRSLWDIKNDINARYNLLQSKRKLENAEISKADAVGEKLFICRELLSSSTNILNGIDEMAPVTPCNARIAYWYSNGYAKEAYSRFESLFTSCEEVLADNFNAVCESIDENTQFGIIPITNSSDGRLMSFYRIIDKYDLKISAVCKIESPDGNGFTKFALVGKNPADFKSGGVKKIEFATNRAIPDIIYVLEHIGGKVGEITSIPSPYGESEYNVYLSAELSQSKIKEFWLYSYLFMGDIDTIGIYTEI